MKKRKLQCGPRTWAFEKLDNIKIISDNFWMKIDSTITPETKIRLIVSIMDNMKETA